MLPPHPMATTDRAWLAGEPGQSQRPASVPADSHRFSHSASVFQEIRAQMHSANPPSAVDQDSREERSGTDPSAATPRPARNGSSAPPWALHYGPDTDHSTTAAHSGAHNGIPDAEVNHKGDAGQAWLQLAAVSDAANRDDSSVPGPGLRKGGNGAPMRSELSTGSASTWKRPVSMAPDWTPGGGQELVVSSPKLTGCQVSPRHFSFSEYMLEGLIGGNCVHLAQRTGFLHA